MKDHVLKQIEIRELICLCFFTLLFVLLFFIYTSSFSFFSHFLIIIFFPPFLKTKTKDEGNKQNFPQHGNIMNKTSIRTQALL